MEKVSLFLFTCLGLVFCCQGVRNNERPDDVTDHDGAFRVLVVEQGRGQVKLFHSSGKLLDSVVVGYNPHEITVDQRGEKVYVSNFGVEDYDNTIGTPGTTLSVLDLKDLSKVQDWTTYRSQRAPFDTCKAPHGVKLRPPDETELFVNVEYCDSMLVYDTNNGRIKRAFPLAKGTHNFEFSLSGDTIWTIAGDSGVYQYDAETGRETRHFPTASAVRGLTLASDRKALVLSCWNEIYLVDAANLKVKQHFTDLGVKQIIYSCLTPDEKHLLAPCPYDNLVLVINLASGEIESRIPCGKAPIYVHIAPNGSEAFVSNALDHHMSVIDLEGFNVRPFGNVFKPNGFVFLDP